MNNQDYLHCSYGAMTDFLAIPRLLVQHPLYRTLSSESKLIYALLLEKLADCKHNHWFDEENKAYVLFPDYQMQEILNISTEKLLYAYCELDVATGIGLVERQAQELDKPTRIYVKKFHCIHNTDIEIIVNQASTEPPTKEEYYARLKEFENGHMANVIPFSVGG